jgi:hypothetical protein
MTQISLSKVYTIIDEERGEVLETRRLLSKGSLSYLSCSLRLRMLNRLKRKFALVSDADQLSLGL